MAPPTVLTSDLRLVLSPSPLSPAAFAPFGAATENPCPAIMPQSVAAADPCPPPLAGLPYDPIIVNQGSAIRYRHVADPKDYYSQAPSGVPARPTASLFVCAARRLENPTAGGGGRFPVSLLERHPFTTQTFVPLGARPGSRYLVIVAPTLPPSDGDAKFAVPTCSPPGDPLPGRGLPDLARLVSFIAYPGQAVTYGAGTWHAPMAALEDRVLGKDGALDFMAMQSANGVAEEDCQEVTLEGGRIVVEVPGQADGGSKL